MESYNRIAAKILYTFFLIGVSVNGFGQRKNIIFESTFESKSSISKWYEKNVLNLWSTQISTQYKRDGVSSARFELKRGLDIGNGPRAELGMAPQSTNEFWYGFSLLFPNDYKKDNSIESIVQFQSEPDFLLGETWRSAPLYLGVYNNRFILEIRSSPKKVNYQGDYTYSRIDLGAVPKEIWSDWVFHVKWAFDNTGILEIWNNNKKLVSRINLPNSYNDKKFPYFKIGIYKWEWSDPTTKSTTNDRIYFADEVRVGNSKATFYDVAPGKFDTVTLPIISNTLVVKKNNSGSYSASFTASKTVSNPSKFILYVSSNKGKTYLATYSETASTLTKNKVYQLTFK